ncbi:Conserved_hypothetical protein [Hexamita inflata]|uniref:Transmembrane protein n=1 Tax=Hexamita inflata TaxID=28002 RepID=A0AA86NVX7_9EUKA|nr:Conserved hypothetical protein [Hexamita inflata]
MNTQIIIDSNINISIKFQVLTGALLCIQCDIQVQSCNLIFIASGQQISGMIIEPKLRIIVQQSFIQYRINSMNSSGLTNVIKQLSITFVINECKLIGSNLVQSQNNGYITSTIYINVQLNITQFDVCVDQTSRFGQRSVQITTIGSEEFKCDMCNEQSVVYGLCGDVLQYSELANGMYQCIYPFEFVDNKCICAQGYLLNKSTCINIIESINNMNNLVNSNISEQIQLLIEQKVENSLVIVDQSILSNISEIENRMLFNYSKSDYNLLINTSILDSRIFSNITNVQKDIIIVQIKADENLLQNTTVLDWRIFNNISQQNSTIQNLTLQLKDVNNSLLLKNEIIEQQLQKQNLIIEQQKKLVDNLTQQLNCTRYYGYSIVNGSCIQVTCAILGQQSINGICQCTNINSIVQSGSCVCPPNSNVIGTACVCSIIGQTLLNGQCACSTTGAFVNNGVCTCGVNGINISNTCSCPSGASLVNGVCTCSNINEYILGNQCVCPTYSQLTGTTCICPSNSKIINNECVCNQISGQIMNSGVCLCQTTGAFVQAGACTCGQYAVNSSDTCTCPTNSTLVNNVCTCDKIVGQQMVDGSCQCPSGQQIINNSCQLSSYVINISNFECSQQIFISNFDINSITNYISAISNLSSGYVFSSSFIIQHAFIDISDNVYTSTVYPIFQSQNTFTNLKIQFGTQQLNSGSLIINSSLSSILVNQMIIISKPGSQFTVNTAQLNILTSTTISSNITDLLVNLYIAPSRGNITLIQNINGILNISGYQVLGTYVSTQTISMIAINVNAAAINMNYINLKFDAFNVGNCSSYLFGNAISSQFNINNFAVIIGNSSNILLLGSISTSSSDFYQFGGIIAYIKNDSVVNVNNVLIDSYQKFSTNYVYNSGILFGNVYQISSCINIKNICLQQSIISTTQYFYIFGLLGYIQGNASLQSASVIFSVQGTNFYCFGIFGIQIQSSLYVEVISLKTFVSFSSSSGEYIGSIFGAEQAQKCSVQNTIVGGSLISLGSNYVSGVCGQTAYTNMTILNSTISKINISGQSYIGSIVGHCSTDITIYLTNSKILFVSLTGFGVNLIVGNLFGNIYFSGSSSTSNYINGVQQSDCAILSNWQVGC